MSSDGISMDDFPRLNGRYVRTRSGIDGYEPGTLGIVGPVQYDREGRPQLAVYWRPEMQCTGEATASWYGPGSHPLSDLELLP